MTIANPVYDIVFKYLMEDERIARTILSALLKKEVVAVKMRPHEYASDNEDSLMVFRIDFGATVRDENGRESLILIELQKTWLETETLRFRRYLGVHYSNPENLTRDGNALPMVAVYLLGHKVGDITEPVLYVSNTAHDYNGNLVTNGMPDPFVDSLTHDSIIVQIPRLHGQINNRLDMVLSIFDQSRIDEYDHHKLCVDDAAYQGDAEMDHILRRLTMAVADTKLRQRMNVEDEYYSIIEKRDTEILLRDRELAEKTAQLDEKTAQLDEKMAQLDEKTAQLDEKTAQLDEKTAQLAKKDELLGRMAKMLHEAGKAAGEIASSLGIDIENVRRMINNK
ncbi:MAG: hypothetical protein IJT30_12340 [Muribaculaceae bacterium]|nr:hypothetical protein [Muribaculaceae bacterium]